jgi:hypothetical protein
LLRPDYTNQIGLVSLSANQKSELYLFFTRKRHNPKSRKRKRSGPSPVLACIAHQTSHTKNKNKIKNKPERRRRTELMFMPISHLVSFNMGKTDPYQLKSSELHEKGTRQMSLCKRLSCYSPFEQSWFGF